MTLRVLAAVVGLALAAGTAAPARAGEPQARVEETVGAIAAVLGDPAPRGTENDLERKERVRGIIRDAFDFAAMTEAAMGRHWAALDAEKRRELVDLFGALFERSYDRLVVRFLGRSRTVYGGESVANDRALVRTTLVREHDDELPVDYHISYDGRRWRMWDVDVDGVSLAAKFRSQFDAAIRASSVDRLIARIEAKLAVE
ncbi:MAG TPA: ABC transporter substrate-binding protein [Candidatus Limnocylindria bacterium]|nr:ABC transporter substrate-binding protein [Candidatus Limnocylindria bacterium]